MTGKEMIEKIQELLDAGYSESQILGAIIALTN